MKKVFVPLVAAVAICFFLALAIAQGPAADDPKAGGAGALERYIPDQHPQPRPGPQPRKQDVIYARAIVLTGRNAKITLNADGDQPSITLESTRTNEKIILYLTSRGQAALGILTPARTRLSVGMFSEGRSGMFQIADPWGVEVMDRQELIEAARRRGSIGALPKK